jgi:hypothetical protein
LPLEALPLDALPLDALPLDALPLDALPLDALPLDALPLDALLPDEFASDPVESVIRSKRRLLPPLPLPDAVLVPVLDAPLSLVLEVVEAYGCTLGSTTLRSMRVSPAELPLDALALEDGESAVAPISLRCVAFEDDA